jgi:hypothetical protein
MIRKEVLHTPSVSNSYSSQITDTHYFSRDTVGFVNLGRMSNDCKFTLSESESLVSGSQGGEKRILSVQTSQKWESVNPDGR